MLLLCFLAKGNEEATVFVDLPCLIRMINVFHCVLLLSLASVSAWQKNSGLIRFILTKNGHSLAQRFSSHPPPRLPSMGITMSSVPTETTPPASLSLPLPDPDKIDPEDIAEWILNRGSKNLVIIDVRDDDFEGGHVKGCTNIPSGIFMDKWNSCDGLLTKYADNSEAQVTA